MWSFKVVIFLTTIGICLSIRRPENESYVGASSSNRQIFRQRAQHSAATDIEQLQSPTFSILSHMAQPLAMRPRSRTKPEALPVQGEELNVHKDEFTTRSETLPLRSSRKPETRRRSKPSFNIALDTSEVENNFQKRRRPETGDEARKIPPVYVPMKPASSLKQKPIITNEPEIIITEDNNKYEPVRPNYPRYSHESGPKIEHDISALLTPDPEANEEIQEEGKYDEKSQINTNYEPEQSKSNYHREYANSEVLNEPLHYEPRPSRQKINRRPAVKFNSQKQTDHSVQHNNHRVVAEEVFTYKPERVKIQRPTNTEEYQQINPNSYNQFEVEATPFYQPERNEASEYRPKPFTNYNPQNIPKKVLKKQPVKFYNNYDTSIKDQQLEKREALDQKGSHSGGGYLDQNGLEFVSDTSNTLKDPSHGRITFQIHGQEGPHSYRFGYDTGKGPHRQFRYEEKDGYGEVKGRYGFYDESGKLQMVNYSAHPEHGYQAEVVPAPKY